MHATDRNLNYGGLHGFTAHYTWTCGNGPESRVSSITRTLVAAILFGLHTGWRGTLIQTSAPHH